MIVRISGEGQFELGDAEIKRLDELDSALTGAYHQRNGEQWHQCLAACIDFVRSGGTPLPDDRVVPSDVIIPPADSTLEEAERFMTDEGLMAPLPA